MSAVTHPFLWVYHEFGISAIQKTGRNAYFIILARTCRMFAFGTNSLVLALFFSELGFSDDQIGLFMTLTLLGDVLLGTLLTLIADRVGRRKIMFAGSSLMILSGCVFAYFENFWILLIAAVVGVVSATGGDFGPFRSIEESMLSHLTTPETRADVLAWYITTSTLGSAVGSEASGRIIHALQSREGWSLKQAYHTLFWIFAFMGIINALLVLCLTDACELKQDDSSQYSRLAQDEEDQVGSEAVANGHDRIAVTNGHVPSPQVKARNRLMQNLSESLTQISAGTRSTMYKLWVLLAVDSLADGMVPYSLTNYYIDEKFHPSKTALGDAQSAAYLLASIGTVFAGPLCRKIGLINTMVFTHIPSSASVLVFPAPSSLWLTFILLFIRAGLNNMDQAPRTAFIAAVVKPEERTAVMGITGMIRTLAATTGPTVTGILAGRQKFWIAYVAAGICRLLYDVGLYLMFVNMPLHQHERQSNQKLEVEAANEYVLEDSSDDGDEIVEMHALQRNDSRSPNGSSTGMPAGSLGGGGLG